MYYQLCTINCHVLSLFILSFILDSDTLLTLFEKKYLCQGRNQSSLSEPVILEGSVTWLVTIAYISPKLLGPLSIPYIVVQSSQQLVQMLLILCLECHFLIFFSKMVVKQICLHPWKIAI